MYCTKCGTKCDDHSKFCKKCGNSLLIEKHEEKNDAKSADIYPKPKKRRKLIIALLLVITCISAVLVFYLTRKDKIIGKWCGYDVTEGYSERLVMEISFYEDNTFTCSYYSSFNCDEKPFANYPKTGTYKKVEDNYELDIDGKIFTVIMQDEKIEFPLGLGSSDLGYNVKCYKMNEELYPNLDQVIGKWNDIIMGYTWEFSGDGKLTVQKYNNRIDNYSVKLVNGEIEMNNSGKISKGTVQVTESGMLYIKYVDESGSYMNRFFEKINN